MEPVVKAALISSSVALAVAVIGVFGLIVAQGRAARSAQANLISVFEREAEEQKAIRAEEAIERRRTASIADRRVVYAKFLRAKTRLPEETHKRERLNQRFEALRPKPGGSLEEPGGSLEQRVQELADLTQRRADMDAVVPLLEAAYDAEREASDEASLTLLEIYILAPLEVVDAAVQWHHHSEANDPDAQARFFNAARADVGVEPLASLPI